MLAMESPVRWGIIGCGSVTEVKSGPGFQLARDSALAAVMRRNGALAADYAARHGVPVWLDDADALIHHPEVDAVSIATPPGSHLEYALRVCAAGKPAYVEKPMARNHAECVAMAAAFRKAGIPLFVAYYRRALPRFTLAKELIDSGRLGRITGIQYVYRSPSHTRMDPAALPWRLIARESGGGLFMDLGCHTLDLFDFLLGPLESVQGDAANLASPCDVEDAVVMTFRAAGVPGAASWCFAASHREDLIQIQGTDARLTMSCFGNEPLRLERADGEELFDRPNPPHIQQPLIQTIVDNLLGRGECPSTGETAARTARVMDIVLEGYYGGRSDAFWERPESWPGRRADAS